MKYRLPITLSILFLTIAVGGYVVVYSLFNEKEIVYLPADEVADNKQHLGNILEKEKPYTRGEIRGISSIDGDEITPEIHIGMVHEVVVKPTEVGSLQYRLFRVGYGDSPPYYTEGQLVVEVTVTKNAPTEWYYFDTAIVDAVSLGRTSVSGSAVTIDCSVGSGSDCEYRLEFDLDTKLLRVEKIK